jgi:hypothetical protein
MKEPTRFYESIVFEIKVLTGNGRDKLLKVTKVKKLRVVQGTSLRPLAPDANRISRTGKTNGLIIHFVFPVSNWFIEPFHVYSSVLKKLNMLPIGPFL